MNALRTNPVASLIVVIIAIAGGVVTVVEPSSLGFDEYVKNVGIAAGLLAIGRGLHERAR